MSIRAIRGSKISPIKPLLLPSPGSKNFRANSNGGKPYIRRNSLRNAPPSQNPNPSLTSSISIPPPNNRLATTIRSHRNHNFGGTPTSLPNTSCTYLSEHPNASESSPTLYPDRNANFSKQTGARPSGNNTTQMESPRTILIQAHHLSDILMRGKIRMARD